MRGDRPYKLICYGCGKAFTPHARGSTPSFVTPHYFIEVYPACAGIDPQFLSELESISCLPRMRGDRPQNKSFTSVSLKFTPHARGSTVVVIGWNTEGGVYPACAGIDRIHSILFLLFIGLPRMRGDRPPYPKSALFVLSFTPHARGSTHSSIT